MNKTEFQTLGIVGSRAAAYVDRGGAVWPADSGLRIEFLIRSQDRWHRPSVEPSTRQTVDPVSGGLVTSCKVPDGDIEATAWVSIDSAGVPHLRVEFENPTPTPVGLAVLVVGDEFCGKPAAMAAQASISGLQVGSIRRVSFSSEPRALLADFATESLIDDVVADGGGSGTSDAESPDGLAGAAVVVPLPHRNSVSVAVSLVAKAAAEPGRLPPAESITKGWDAHLARGARLITGDQAVDKSLAGARKRLLAYAGDGRPPTRPGQSAADAVRSRGLLAAALRRWGFAAEADTMAKVLAEDFEEESTTELAMAWLIAVSDAEPQSIADAVGIVDGAFRKRRFKSADHSPAEIGWAKLGLSAASSLLGAAGQPEAAKSVEALLADQPSEPTPADHLFDEESAVLVLSLDDDDPVSTALGLLALPSRFVRETTAGLEVVAPPAAGGNWELHDLPTVHGPVSAAVRWHGQRPALLWDIPEGITITAPSLNKDFTSTDPSGETLL